MRKYFDVFCTVYLDDMLIYSTKKEDHASHVLQVLRQLHEQDLQVDTDKCEFSTTRLKYLGTIVTTNGVEMHAKKTEAIQEWKALTTVKEMQAILGFANFYLRFIANFSMKVKPLVGLIKGKQYTTKLGKKKVKYETFDWSTECQKAFKALKQAFTTESILAHYDSALETWVKIDASDFETAGVLSQMHNGVLRPVAVFSKKM